MMPNVEKLNIEKALKRSIHQAPTLDFQKLAAMPVEKMVEHDYITRQENPGAKKQSWIYRHFRPLSAAVASCMVMLICVGTWFLEFKTPDSVIALDANQSIEIVANKHKQVLSVKAYDEEVQNLIDEENFDKISLEDSVGVIVSTMIKNGYLDENKNVIMVSVENKSPDKAENLAASLNQVIVETATAQNVAATVVKQTVTPDQEAGTAAEQLSVSTGKLNVMQEIVAKDPTVSMDSLATLSLTELLDMSKEKSVDLSNVIQVPDGETQKDVKVINKNDPVTTPETVGTVTQAAPTIPAEITTTTETVIVSTPTTPEITTLPVTEPVTPVIDPVVTETPEAVPTETEDKTTLKVPQNVDVIVEKNEVVVAKPEAETAPGNDGNEPEQQLKNNQ
jgi:hypothetical protein